MDKILEVKNLKLHYHTSKGAVRALDDVSFDIERGETLGVVGESGCGKTTAGSALLRMPAPPGRIEAESRIILGGRDIMVLREEEMRREVRWTEISMVFQGAMNSLTPVYTVGRQMTETIRVHRPMNKNEAREIIAEYLGLVGLSPETAGRYPHELSGGMKQRVVIATALFLRPKLVILDEPTTALDVIVQAQIVNLLKRLKAEFGLSFIFITHDLALEAEVADRLLVLYAGKIAELGPGRKIFGKPGPAHPYTRRLLEATPRLKVKTGSLAFIPGTPPDLLDPPRGCRFHPRCRLVIERCREEEPPLLEIVPGHRAACWRPEI
jgi:peptide/nickel transport system ATP-binding protein